MLISARARVNVARKDGSTALHLAAQEARHAIVDTLITAGANVNARSADGWTPCHFAIALDDRMSVRRLVNAGANVNDVFAHGESLLHVAALTARDNATIRSLVEAGANVNATNKRGQSACRVAACNAIALRALIDAGAELDQADADGLTALAKAVQKGNVVCSNLLVAAGANVKWVDHRANTLLHAYLSKAMTANVAFVRQLVAWGVDVNALNADGDVASEIVVKSGNVKCLCALFAVGADLAWLRKAAASSEVSDLVAAATNAERMDLAAERSKLVRARGAEVCIGLQSLGLDALQMCEILQFACAAAGQFVPFHLLWNIAVKAKHFKASKRMN